ncbi:Putative 4-hydroxy-2-oxoglutarate aldolase, mitochondrial [Saitozyma sp. JCM 24511]|nr:Putative 4-hydroxy-2-oxoglutarate aldolase, mitochondrial [Saitozyma sp. JCM 24511]
MTVPTSTTATCGKALPGGIYCPSISFFKPTAVQELDLDTYTKHIEFLAKAGVHGVVVLGSTAEAVALTRDERKQLIRVSKETFAAVGNPGAIIAGTGSAQSTQEAIELSIEAASAGAEFALVLPPSYYPGAMTPAAIQEFFEDVADASPIPVIIYSYPAVSSGIVMDTDLVRRLAKHPNIVGIKHTDHEVGRIAREASIKSYGSPFTIVGGASDYLLGALAVGGKGAITGMANVTPRVIAKAYELYETGQHAEAIELAGLVSRSEWALGKGGILGTKYAIQWSNSYPSTAALARKPLPLVPEYTKQNIEQELAEIVALDRQLEKEGYVGLGFGALKATSNGKLNGKADLLDTIKQKVAAL